jgi:trans-aconitate methyltransferase
LDFILEYINDESVVLDLGSNDGTLTTAIADKAKWVIGIDHDLTAINLAKSKHKKKNLEFIHQDANDYLKESQLKFDILILSHILEHIDEPEQFILNFKSNFKFIYIELPDFDKTYLNHYRKDLKMELIYTDADHVSEFDRYEMADLLRKTNLEVLKEEYRFGIMKIWCKVI